ncbi:hypothetical protein LJC46_06305 [Desulfovibrio sp. OttesenSCG-928-G15]|nr:hypothetical protein [Desulfovibrio sp. OttesenSCG-928-G15]
MTRPLQEEESLPTDEPGLTGCIASAEAEMAEMQTQIKNLMAEEDPGRGIVHASAIHDTKQRYMMLRYKRDFCAARLARIRQGF